MEEVKQLEIDGVQELRPFDKQTEKTEKTKQPVWKYFIEPAAYFVVFLLTLALFLWLKPEVQTLRRGAVAQAVGVLIVVLSVAVIAYMGMTKRLTTGKILVILLVIGYAVRVGYMLYTPAATRQHDMYSKNYNGHEAYAWTIFDTGKLPTHNEYQFYHPPLNAILQAGFMHFMNGFAPLLNVDVSAFAYAKPSYIGEVRYFLYSSCQILAVLYSFITAVVSIKIIKMFVTNDKLFIFLSAFVVLFPRNIQFSAMLNNDMLSYMLSMIALYFALKWWKSGRSFFSILLCGLAVGLGMMAKLSSATVCLPIAGIFIYEFIATLRKKEGAMPLLKMVIQYGSFLVVCATIGLWFQVYAKIRFDQSFGHVFSKLNKKLYTGDYSFFERFVFPFELKEFFGSVFCIPFNGHYYLPAYLMRSAIFGEFTFWQGEGFAITALIFGFVAMLMLFVGVVWSVVWYFRKRKKDPLGLERAPVSFKDLLFVFLLMQSQVVSDLYFNISMPYACTMDFRYIMPIILAVALTFSCVQKVLVTENGKFSVVLSRLLYITFGVFTVTSTVFYCVCI